MAIVRQDEILEKVLASDSSAVPRYNLRSADGTLLGENIALELANAVTKMGTPVNAAALNEMLAASGVTGGTSTAYTLAQENFSLFDGAPVRFRVHTATGANATLNVNGTGAKPVKTVIGDSIPSGIPVGMWVNVIYSSSADAYILTGGSVSSAQIAAWDARQTADQVKALAAERGKVISSKVLTADAASVSISIPSGYTRYRLTGFVVTTKDGTNTSSCVVRVRGGTTKGYCITLGDNESKAASDNDLAKTRACNVQYYSGSFLIDMIKTSANNYAGISYGIGSDRDDAYGGRSYFTSFNSTSLTSMTITASSGNISAGSSFLLEGLA